MRNLARTREMLPNVNFWKNLTLSVASDKFIDFGAIAPEGGVIEGRARLFVGVLKEQAEKAVTPELGHGALVFYARDEIDDLIERGEVEDASTVVLLLKHAHMLEKK